MQAWLSAPSGSRRRSSRPSPVWRSTTCSGSDCSPSASPSSPRNKLKACEPSSPSSDNRVGCPVASRCRAASSWRDSSASCAAISARSRLRSRTLASGPRGAASPNSRRRGLIVNGGASNHEVLAATSSASAASRAKCRAGCSANAARENRRIGRCGHCGARSSPRSRPAAAGSPPVHGRAAARPAEVRCRWTGTSHTSLSSARATHPSAAAPGPHVRRHRPARHRAPRVRRPDPAPHRSTKTVRARSGYSIRRRL